jgi:DNA-binding CsgD family transcriptional regulator
MTAEAEAAAMLQWEPNGRVECDERAQSILKAFWDGMQAADHLPPDLRGLAEGVQLGPPGVRRSLLLEREGERLRVDALALGEGRTEFRLLVEASGIVPTNATETGTQQGPPLTPREREVALLVADGLRSREVAEKLGIAAQTVKSHLKTIFDKLGVRNRVELARRLAN